MKPYDVISPALTAFLDGLIDYAGMFAPANLALQPAIMNYAHYRHGSDNWMLSRFIIPASRLSELDEALLGLFSADTPLHLALLTTDLQTASAEIGRFLAAHEDRVTINIIETRLSTSITHESQIALDAAMLQRHALPARIFYELPFDAAWDAQLPNLIDTLARHNQLNGADSGFKLRCGGVAAQQFPSSVQVARAITLCRDADITLKCTAGLHHPIRHFDVAVGTMMHGFINVFGGGVLATVHGLDSAELTAIIAEEDADAFRFSAETFSWRDLSADAIQIITARQNRLLSFGSCSFDEPRTDLQTLNLLPLHT